MWVLWNLIAACRRRRTSINSPARMLKVSSARTMVRRVEAAREEGSGAGVVVVEDCGGVLSKLGVGSGGANVDRAFVGGRYG